MSDFCLQCSEELGTAGGYYGYSDFKGLSRKKDTNQGFLNNVICEGCGHIQVDHDGRCVSNCLKEHKKDEV